VHDLGDETAPFFAMKRLTGTTLADVVSSRDHAKWPRRVVVARFVDMCLAIELAHKRGVIHRDRQRRTQERAQEQLHVQKWQLEQLAPSSGSPTK